MPTTNLISKSNGNLLIQSGNGTPDHVAPIGSIYLDNNGGGLYKYAPVYSGDTTDSSLVWEEMVELNSVSISSTNSSGTIVTSATGSWYSLSGSTYGWSTNFALGFSVNNGRITYTGSSGTFILNASATIKYNANLANYRFGISKNVSTPVQGFYTSATLSSATAIYQDTNIYGLLSLASGDTIELAFNSPNTASTTSNMSGATLSLQMVG